MATVDFITHTYSVANDTAFGVVNGGLLKVEIEKAESPEITISTSSIGTLGDVLTIVFKAAISPTETAQLDAVVAAHNGFLKSLDNATVLFDGNEEADIFTTADRIKIDVAGTLNTTDGAVKVSDNDTNPTFLEDKVISQNNKITISTLNDGMDEDLQIQFNPSNLGTSELNNDAGFVDAAGAASVAPIQSVNGEVGSVVLDAADVGAATAAQGALADSAVQPGDNVSDLTNDAGYITAAGVPAAETNTTLQTIGNTLRYTNEDGTFFDIDLSVYLDDTNLSRIVSGTVNGGTGIATFTRDDSSTFDVDFGPLISQFGTRSINQAGHGFSLTNNVPLPAYINGAGDVVLAQANNLTTLSAFYITEIVDADNFLIQQHGFLTAVGHGLIVGQYYFLSDATAGDITATEPLATISDVCLYVVDSNTLLLIDNRPEDKNSIEKFLIKTRNTDTTTNINQTSFTEIPVTGTTSLNENSFYTVVGNGIEVPQTRSYHIKASVHVESNATRANLRVQIAINGTPQGDIAATGYIRNSSGHNESSYHISEVFVLNANDVVTVEAIRESSPSGAITLSEVGTSSLTVEAR